MGRFSNSYLNEDHNTKKVHLFMALEMSEYCPIRRGYDQSRYRYEIDFEV